VQSASSNAQAAIVIAWETSLSSASERSERSPIVVCEDWRLLCVKAIIPSIMFANCCCCCREDQSHTEEGGRGYLASESDVGEERESTRSHGSSLSPEEKEREKARLQKLVKDFARDAVRGMAVSIIDPSNGSVKNSVFRLEKHLDYISLDPYVNDAGPENFPMKAVVSICKGKEILKHIPLSQLLGSLAVGVFFSDESNIVFSFPNSAERDRFYTCIKILRMSVDINPTTISSRKE